MKQAHIFILLGSLMISAGCAQNRMHHAVKAPANVRFESREDTVYFDFDKTDVRPDAQSKLDDVAADLKKEPKAVCIVEGHADPIGPARYNEALSENRARSVRVYLRDRGANHQRITILSKGEREPAVKDKGVKANEPNRRVEIKVTLSDEDKEIRDE